jgi:hypothetical protein
MQARDYYRLAIARSPNNGDCYAGLTDIATRHASYLRRIGKPDDDIIRQGLEAAERSVSISPTYLDLLNQGDCQRLAAQLQMDRGEDASSTLRQAENSLRLSERVNPDGDYTLFYCQGVLAMVAGQAELAQNRSPEKAWARAGVLLAKAARMSPKSLEPLAAMTRLSWLQGQWQRSSPGTSEAVLRAGIAATVVSFRLKSRQPELQALRGCLFLLQAESVADPGQCARLLGQAQHDLATALSENGFLSREFSPELETVKTRISQKS